LEWICYKIDGLTRKYPQLSQKIIEQITLPETEKKAIASFIHKILAESEVKPRKINMQNLLLLYYFLFMKTFKNVEAEGVFGRI